MYVEWIDFSLANVFVIRIVQSDSSAIFVVYKVFVVVRK